MQTWKRTLIVSTALLTACASQTPAPEAPQNQNMPVEKRTAQTQTISSWALSGAMSAKNAQKAWSAGINWQQQGATNYQIRLMGPLGGGTVLVEREGGAVTYKDGPKTATSNNADDLLLKQTGIRLPVNNLYYWVRGLPAPGPVQASKYDEFNHLSMLKQSGYTVNYERYTSTQKGDLPSKIRLTGNGVTIKLVVKNWTV
ncbi:outer membrane lipoprotein LolB (plasmid) [Legionella adelaidensis]|uniref:Outer-membrane lipoprotein LolB n=1 Tax=Legionella adelaidensis TaxID=45056 RepID=A0A0W0R5S2_9GAMM|nr:lipoprotein insertase outer membrane protein LolB [Legionella adelaidensis]KTC66449.1 outer membrane lipoprotein LolB [Legionella adelaidensis]VEH86263.1 outer membrane lipoprotein LolB [Legionella adelaidensis]